MFGNAKRRVALAPEMPDDLNFYIGAVERNFQYALDAESRGEHRIAAQHLDQALVYERMGSERKP